MKNKKSLTGILAQVTSKYAYGSGLGAGLLSHSGMLLRLLLFALLHLLGFFPLDLQQRLGGWLLGHTSPTRQLGLGLQGHL